MSNLRCAIAGSRQRHPVSRRHSNSTRISRRPCCESLEDRTAPAVFTVSNLADSGAGSLRQAILDANVHLNDTSDPTDTINFAVAATVAVAGQLPALNDTTGGTIIDGRTAPGYAGAPVVVIRGPGSTSGL